MALPTELPTSVIYDTTKDVLLDAKNTHNFISRMIIESVIVVAGLTSYPFDTVHRQMIMQSGHKVTDMLDCWGRLSMMKGPKLFSKGHGPMFLGA